MEQIIKVTTDPERSAREIENDNIARQLASEGIVLLKNEGRLPLEEKKIALYGSGARMTVSGGTGSGATHPRHTVGIEEGLIASGFEILTKNWLDRYDEHYRKSYRVCSHCFMQLAAVRLHRFNGLIQSATIGREGGVL